MTRIFTQFVMLTLCLMALCAITAVSLFRQQAAVTGLLKDHMQGRKAVIELRECLRDVIELEKNRNEEVAVLHERVRDLLETLKRVADGNEERNLHGRMVQSFNDYLNLWKALPPKGAADHEEAFHRATQLLEEDVLQPCEAFEESNSRRIEYSAVEHERILGQHAWGLAVVGGLGGVAGGVLGYGVARNFTRTLQRLRVQVRDAAGKLLPDEPEIILRGEGGMQSLGDDMDRLSVQIGETMHKLQQRELEVLRAKQLAAVGQLAAGVGHEIRNPLTSIKLLIQTAIEDGGDGLSTEDLIIIEAEIRRMEQSLKTFLDFAKPLRIERQRTTIDGVVGGVIDLLRGRATKQKVAIVFEKPPHPVPLEADPQQLRQVFVNLGLNALDAMPGGGTLTFCIDDRTAGQVFVEVCDTGPGIDPGMVPRLFEPFASTKDTGLGLGLVISRRIVENHQGTIGVAKAIQGGAAFTVKLPREG